MNKNLAVGIIVIIVFLFILGKIIGIASNTSQSATQKKETITQPTEMPQSQFEYELLAVVEGKTDQNVSVLIKVGEPNPKGIAEEIQQRCTKQCNISLYDDKKAFELDAEYTNKMMSYDVTVAQREAWKKKNTVFLADHLVATVGYSFGDYSEYPMKDWYYKELKGEK